MAKSRIDSALERFAIKLLRDADRGNNRARTAVAKTPADGNNAAPIPADPGPTLTERTKVFAAVVQFRQIQARIEPDDPGTTGGDTLSDLQRELNRGAPSRGSASSAKSGHA